MAETLKVLVPIDFSSCSRRALNFAIEYGSKFDCEFYLFHVADPVNRLSFVGSKLAHKLDDELERMEKMVLEEMDRVLEEEGQAGLIGQIHRRVASGVPAEEILRMAGNVMADLIIMGTHGRTGVSRLFAGSVAEKVVRQSPCTVICVKPKDLDFVMP